MGHDVIVLGGSGGAIDVLNRILVGLPADFPAYLFAVLHRAPSTSRLSGVVGRDAKLRVVEPADGQRFERSTLYLAPPDRHMVIDKEVVHLVHGPRENWARPAIDPLFRSAARAFGSRVIGVILTGSLDDGAAGLVTIRSAGGLTVVQDPDDAEYRGMPEAALATVDADYTVPADEIAPLLRRLVGDPAARPAQRPLPPVLEFETVAAIDHEVNDIDRLDGLGKRSILTCPECNGSLWELHSGNLMRYRCHVGHAFSEETLSVKQIDEVERALWAALRSLEEQIAMTRRMADRARERGQDAVAKRHDLRVEELDGNASTVRRLLLQPPAPPGKD